MLLLRREEVCGATGVTAVTPYPIRDGARAWGALAKPRRLYYFFAASIVRAKGSVQSGIATVRVASRHAASIISYVTRPKRRSIGLDDVFHRVTMQVFVRDHFPMIAAPVQCNVDGIAKRSHCVR